MHENGSGIGTDEQIIDGVNGWTMLIVLLAVIGSGIYLAVPPVGLTGFIIGVFLCAALVTNMMTVLLSESGAQPVIQMSQATQ